MSNQVNIVIIAETGEIGRIAAVAVLMLTHETPFIYPYREQQEKVSGSIEEIVMQIHKGFHEELLRIPVVIEELFLMDKQDIINSQKEILNPALQTGSTQKFNKQRSMHPP